MQKKNRMRKSQITVAATKKPNKKVAEKKITKGSAAHRAAQEREMCDP
jgi:hypothetical protein